MARVPQFHLAYVELAKLTDYLLSPTHEDGRSKAAFYQRFGFTLGRPQLLEVALLQHIATYDFVRAGRTPEGLKFTVVGDLTTPDGRNPSVRSVWEVGRNGRPRLVTAYPYP